ncbi:MAG: hypothetical protein ACYTGG_06735 [Planctomycetota bacterium]|jgi:hypothetical protein
MTREQRILVAVGLLLLAWLLHVQLCDWGWKETRHRSATIAALPHGTPPAGLQGVVRGLGAYTGLFVHRGDPLEDVPHGARQVAVLLGVILPIGLVLLDAWLVLGWRAQSRVRRGLCLHCGYDLRGDGKAPLDRCPECGWIRTTG